MANGYGGSSGSSSSSRTTTISSTGQRAPVGYHYMPDGTLMSDEEHARLYSSRIIKNFDIDLSDLPQASQKRTFKLTGDEGCEFILEVKDNATGNYYNFITNKFQSTYYGLEESIKNTGVFEKEITFPSIVTKDTVNGAVSSATSVTMDTAVASTMAVGDRVTGNDTLNNSVITVASIDSTNVFSLSVAASISDGVTLFFTGNAQYDISLYAKPGTKHIDYNEVRFGDDSIDINSSIGSNSLMLKKVIYQYADVELAKGKL